MVPILGIINANLPILGPAFKHIFNSSLLTTTVKKSTLTTSSGSQFRRIADGEYPLVNIDGECINTYTLSPLATYFIK
jgi:hypothetical protein